MDEKMDTTMDHPSFDLQSIHLSYEERRWLSKQRHLHKLDDSIQLIINLHKTIHGNQQFSSIQTPLSSTSMISKVPLDDKATLYYPSDSHGFTNPPIITTIDQFRLHNQQMCQLIFNDLCVDINYRIFIIIMEGFIFYSSQTAKEYSSSFAHEMKKMLSSFHSYIQSRSTKIISLISLLRTTSLTSYKIVRTNSSNNIGILFQLLPKIQYNINSGTEYNSILAIGEYAKEVISLEELRFIDYSMNLKQSGLPLQATTSHTFTFGTSASPTFVRPVASIFGTPPIRGKSGSAGLFQGPVHILDPSPIVYPYDDTIVYSQKYPAFWTGKNHTNENGDTLFETIPIEKNTPEFIFVQKSFHQTVSQSQINIAFIERIQNPHLWEKFNSHRSYMRRKNGNDNLNDNWLFHGTKSDNHHRIMSHGFNRSYCRDHVLYGRGVYFSRYACYSCNYSDRKDLSFLFLCRVLVGNHTRGSNDIRVPPTVNLSNGKQIQADSTTNESPYTIVCTFHDDQNYPEYMITYMNKLNEN